MPQRDNTLFRTSCLVAAMAALSACSSTPRQADELLGSISETSSNAWERTRYLLGFTDEAKAKTRERTLSARTDRRLLDEVDIAMLEEDAIMPGGATAASANEVVDSPAWSSMAIADGEQSDSALIVEETMGDPELTELSEVGELPELSDDSALSADQQVLVSAPDLEHVVGASETLWDIAKATTGDATNWHVLADVNDLGPNASVFPGQTLTIPADMVRTDRVINIGAEGATDVTMQVADASDSAGGSLDVGADSGAAVSNEPGTIIKLGPNETLWDFAKRTTGDATNWQAIAAANGFDDTQATRVRPGQSITVPDTLLRDSLATVTVADASDTDSIETDNAVVPAAQTLTISEVSPTDLQLAELDKLMDATSLTTDTAAATAVAEPEVASANAGMEVNLPTATSATVEDNTLLADARASVEGTAVVGDSDYQANAESIVAGASALSDTPAEIMVSGSYYPKAVYNDADFSSALLMRVSPGTTLQVSRAVGPWFEVQTAEGTGFVHTRDIK